ncbi:CLUMA_CG019888, isoform A [Clunio marinus]|uniref:CLUMA_CG019888, isoform A n=1 Tax=Clunio marinus TaxID=568069 RepID=A0A1J1J2C8_9DIPT|nr:CLUMA_CG019888, isoform A [Clunio marinus]
MQKMCNSVKTELEFPLKCKDYPFTKKLLYIMKQWGSTHVALLNSQTHPQSWDSKKGNIRKVEAATTRKRFN